MMSANSPFTILLTVIILSIVMLGIVSLNIVMLSVVSLSIAILSVTTPVIVSYLFTLVKGRAGLYLQLPKGLVVRLEERRGRPEKDNVTQRSVQNWNDQLSRRSIRYN